MTKTKAKKTEARTETREEERDRKLAEIGKVAYESIAEMVGKLDPEDEDEEGDRVSDRELDRMRDEAREAILEDALSVEVRSGWYTPSEAGAGAPEEFCLLLGTGGPAVRIIGELDQYGEPDRARLETQDWGTAWTEYRQDVDRDVLLTYARCFYYGEG